MKSIWIFLLFFASTSCIDNPITDNRGQTRFVSADETGFAISGSGISANNGTSENDGTNNSGGERQVEEGDIYRPLQNNRILNLNSFRGLQIIDISDPTSPEIIGQVRIVGSPIEMYQVGNFVYILMNNWWGYYGHNSQFSPEQYNGGVVVSVDISNQQDPKIISRQRVPGAIMTSRLTRGQDKESLYVVANNWEDGSTYVNSFSIARSTGALVPASELPLSGYIQSVQATGDRLLVARADWSQPVHGGTLSIIDISSPSGTMIEGGSIAIKGFTTKKSDMNIYNDVLRVVSTRTGNTNHIETFDVSDISNPLPLGHETFGDGQDLFATIFIENTAFFVTYFRQDPFHAFSILDDGTITEESEFIVSGFNSWFKAVSDNTRLIGIGMNDENRTNSPAVSLYTIEDLKNPTPLLDRDQIPVDWGWSEANWDDRAFSVIEKAINVNAPNGEVETGLVLLPFTGWNGTEYISGVQMFSFSDTTVTKRGLLDHNTPVRRTFIADRSKDLVANISESDLSLHETSDVDSPNKVSTLALSPNYSQLFSFGNYLIRRQASNYQRGWDYDGSQNPMDSIQIFDKNMDPETRNVMAEFAIPSFAQVVQAGDLFLTVEPSKGEIDYELTIGVWDISNPVLPQNTDTFRTTIPGLRYNDTSNLSVLDNALVFHENIPHEKIIGTRHDTTTYVVNERNDCYDDDGYKACSYIEGGQRCSYVERIDGSKTREICEDQFVECTQSAQGETECEKTPMPSDNLESTQREREEIHYSAQRTFHVVDLSDPKNLSLRASITTQMDQEAVGVLVDGNNLYYSFRKSRPLPDSGRGLSQYFFQTYDFSIPSAVVSSPPINIPGQLIATDEHTIYTLDYTWENDALQSSINRLEISSGLATLSGRKSFGDEQIFDVKFLPPNQLLVTHQDLLEYYSASKTKLTVVNTSGNFDVISEFDVDVWARLNQTVAGRAIFDVPGGILVVNVSDPTPYAQSFFPLQGWSQHALVVDNNLFISANAYGIYKFDLDSQNLLQP